MVVLKDVQGVWGLLVASLVVVIGRQEEDTTTLRIGVLVPQTAYINLVL